jgi:hypothetical protein
MPRHIDVDISSLKEAGDIIHVKDINSVRMFRRLPTQSK